jgi:aspartate racemase
VNDDPSLPESLRDVEQASIDAMRSYVARPYNGRLVLLRAEEQGKRFIGCEFDEAMGWSRLARRGVEVRAVPGSHLTMLGEPHVRGVAAALRGCLDASLGAAVTSVR